MNIRKRSSAAITRRTIAAATLILCTTLTSLPALAVNQNTVLAELETAPSTWTLPTIRTWINDFDQGNNHSVSLGDPVTVTVDATTTAHFVLALVDSYGEVQVIRPAGPASNTTYQFTAKAPVGQYSLFVFATETEIPGNHIGLADGQSTGAMDYNMDAVKNFVTALSDYSGNNLIAKAQEYQFSVEDSSLALQTRGLVKKVSRLQNRKEPTKKKPLAVAKAEVTTPTKPIVVAQKPASIAVVEKPALVQAAIISEKVKVPATVVIAEIPKAKITSTENLDSLSLDIKFQVNSASLTDSGINSLDSLGSALMVMQRTGELPTLLLEGHTDDSGEADYNLNLSEDRANSAKTYLIDRFGLPTESIQAVGFGESAPLMPNTDSATRQINRRVELKVVQ